ncbi:peroxisome biogenesis protein 16 isoform X2 [Henckelia pumila]
MITALNEHIIDSTPVRTRTGCGEPSSFPFSLCITLLKDLETLVEVVAQQLYGEEKKWNFIAITEATKVLLRLAMLQKSGYKMLLHGGENTNDGRDTDDVDAPGNEFASNPGQHGVSGVLSNNHGQGPYNLEGRALFALNRFGENARTVTGPSWLHRVQHQQAIMEPLTTVSQTPTLYTFLSEKGTPGGLFLMGEVLFVLRPLIYVLLIRKYGARSWLPWLASLVVDLIGNGSSSLVSVLWHNCNGFHLSTLEKHELKRRKLLWALYLMRDPVFTKYTSQRLAGTQKLLEPVPLIGLLTEKLIELLVGAQTRYTYMSGS